MKLSMPVMFFCLMLILGLVPVRRAPAADAGDEGDPLIASMKFVKIPKGTFWMGWTTDGKKCAQVEIKADFELAAYLVTQSQWQAIMGRNPSWYSRARGGRNKVQDIPADDLELFPVEDVSWNQVQEFLKRINARQQGKGWHYRLPTQAEWEYCCRNAATTREECSFDFYLEKPTNDLSSTQANFNGAFPAGNGKKGPFLARPTKVGSYPPNKLGLYDMHGNVRQWCEDLLATRDPSRKAERILRGGSFVQGGLASRAGFVSSMQPADNSIQNGFRLARVRSGEQRE